MAQIDQQLESAMVNFYRMSARYDALGDRSGQANFFKQTLTQSTHDFENPVDSTLSLLACAELIRNGYVDGTLELINYAAQRALHIPTYDHVDICEALEDTAAYAYRLVPYEHSERITPLLTALADASKKMDDLMPFLMLAESLSQCSSRLYYIQYPEVAEPIHVNAPRFLRAALANPQFAAHQAHLYQLTAAFDVNYLMCLIKMKRTEEAIALLQRSRRSIQSVQNDSIESEWVIAGLAISEQAGDLTLYAAGKASYFEYVRRRGHGLPTITKLRLLSALSKASVQFRDVDCTRACCREAIELFNLLFAEDKDILTVNEHLFRLAEFFDATINVAILDGQYPDAVGFLLAKKRALATVLDAIRRRDPQDLAAERWYEYAANAALFQGNPLTMTLSMIAEAKIRESKPQELWSTYSLDPRGIQLTSLSNLIDDLSILAIDYAIDTKCWYVARDGGAWSHGQISLGEDRHESDNVRAVYMVSKLFGNQYSKRNFEPYTVNTSGSETFPERKFDNTLRNELLVNDRLPYEEIAKLLSKGRPETTVHLLFRDSLATSPVDVSLRQAGVRRPMSTLLQEPNRIGPSNDPARNLPLRAAHCAGDVSLSSSEIERYFVTSQLTQSGFEVVHIDDVATLREEMSNLDLIWFSSHGGNPFGTPFDRSVQIAGESLYLDELLKMPLLARNPLVVLGSCDTSGFTHQRRAVDTRSIHHAFHHLGASAIVACRWEIDDSAALFGLARFLEELTQGADSALALYRATEFLREATAAELHAFGAKLAPESLRGTMNKILTGVTDPIPYRHPIFWGCLGHYGVNWKIRR